MSAAHCNGNSHSAIVYMELAVPGRVLPIAQMGPNFLVLQHLIDHPPVAKAEIALSIDGREDRWHVCLPEGIKSGQRKTTISRCPGVDGSASR